MSNNKEILCTEFVPVVSEKFTQCIIDEDKPAGCGGQCHAARSIVKYCAKPLLTLLQVLQRTFAIGNVLDGSEHPFMIVEINGVQVHLHRNFIAAFVQANEFAA